MLQVRIKRVYEDFSETDGYRVFLSLIKPHPVVTLLYMLQKSRCTIMPESFAIIWKCV